MHNFQTKGGEKQQKVHNQSKVGWSESIWRTKSGGRYKYKRICVCIYTCNNIIENELKYPIKDKDHQTCLKLFLCIDLCAIYRKHIWNKTIQKGLK